MIPVRCIIVIALFSISITTLVIGITKDIQGCIIGGILSIFCSAIVTMGIMMRGRTVVKITRPPRPSVIKENIINNIAPIAPITPIVPIVPITATAPTIIQMPIDITNPIYEPV
jgi:hypothetical protein